MFEIKVAESFSIKDVLPFKHRLSVNTVETAEKLLNQLHLLSTKQGWLWCTPSIFADEEVIVLEWGNSSKKLAFNAYFDNIEYSRYETLDGETIPVHNLSDKDISSDELDKCSYVLLELLRWIEPELESYNPGTNYDKQ